MNLTRCIIVHIILRFRFLVLLVMMVPETISPSKKDLNRNNDKVSSTKSSCCPATPGMTRFTVLAVLVLRFLFCFATLIPRANLLLIMEAKYAVSVVSVSYLNSLQAIVSTLTGFTVGPVILNVYKENNRRMVVHGSILHTVSYMLFWLVFPSPFVLNFKT